MNDSVRLGLMAPLTGLVEIYGPEIVWAARIACAEVNERGGVLGRPLELVVEDDGSLPPTAVPAALRLIEQHRCVALIGNLLSNSRIAVAGQVAEPRRVPLLNFSFYEGSISGRHFFHFAALPNQQIDQMIPCMVRRYGHKMFFAGNNYEWPRGSIDAAKRALQRLDGDVVGEEYLDIGATPEAIDRLLAQLARSGADVFVPYFAGNDQIRLLTRFAALGLKQHMAVVMGHFDEVMAGQLPPDTRAGLYSSNTYFMSLDSEASRHYLQRLARQPGVHGIWPQGNGVLTNFGEGAYLCVHAFANAVAAAGSCASEDLVAALERVAVQGPQGRVVMDPATHHASVNTYLARCRADGSFEIIERFGCIAPVIPERYREPPQDGFAQPVAGPQALAARLVAELGTAPPGAEAPRQILELADTPVLATDREGCIRVANRSACQLFGYAEQELVGLSVHLLLPPHFRLRHAELLRRFVEGEDSERRMTGRGELTGYRKDGSFIPLEATIAKFHDGKDWLLVVTLRDVSERKRLEEEVARRATHDPLTGLPNRALIRERLGNALLRAQRSGQSLALLFIDLDGFKAINDTQGHAVGDALLKAVGARLIEQVRPGDTVAHLAGDEFVILCEQIEHPATVATLAEQINTTLRHPFELEAATVYLSASIGVAVGGGGTGSADELLRAADTAMYAVKQRGRDGWQFFSDQLQAQARERLAITHGLRGAIAGQELSARFQPIVVASSGQVVGAELLLRWHPKQGEISPAIFIPVAEASGFIAQIGAWVLREGFRAQAAWQRRWGAQAPYVSINLSTRQLGVPTLVEDIAAMLRDTGAEPARILLEITETALMTDVEAHLRVLRRIADLGLRLAVDDFGTGYSSLAQLTRLPVEVLKIDKAFVDGIEAGREACTVMRAIIGLGRGLGLKLVAEGVEQREQQQQLVALDCDFIQGYYFHRPLAEAGFVELIDRQVGAERGALSLRPGER
ncbi:ABC transporter substrate-binding protein [Inhella proteolytica]|uniref:EAL domain-containing protein n=1 Tax=Inhella proteolytica TaxID=2795029 RepID=A0A931NHT3_9BURK|nr:ABC transporter substrate-binding protein [Inhella proteolytica]MBH9578118.1 EAL domain-containing protein [Inhella proteolytica]